MNAYMQRRQKRQEQSKDQATKRRWERLGEAHQLLNKFEEAYEACNGTKPKTNFEHGWYRVPSGRCRRADIERMTAAMWATVHEKELNAPIDNE